MANTQKSIKGTKTEQNVAMAYVAESTAVTRYTFFAQSAQKESFFQVANIFNETAANELRHAKIFLQYLEDGVTLKHNVGIDAGILTPTVDNLGVAAMEEEKEGVKMYTKAAKVAEDEGFADIAEHFAAIASIENHHRDRFLTLQKRIQDGTMWKREQPIKWQCLVCGYIYEGVEPPAKCQACQHPYQHFIPMADNF